jgi:hypothetical protein
MEKGKIIKRSAISSDNLILLLLSEMSDFVVFLSCYGDI